MAKKVNNNSFFREKLQTLMEVILREEVDPKIDDETLMQNFFSMVREREIARIRYEETVDQLNDCYIQLDLHGNCLFLSPTWKTLTGFDLEGSVGTPITEYFHKDSLFLLKKTLKDVVNCQNSSVYYCELKSKEEEKPVVWFALRLKSVLNENQDIVGIRGVITDYTERKTLEESLRLVVAAFENTSEGIMITSVDQKILKVNKSFTKITGYKEKEVLGLSPKLLSSGLHDKKFYAEMWDGLRRTGAWKGEIWDRRKDGSLFPEILCINALKTETGRISHYVALFTDISSVKDAENIANQDPITQLPNRSVFFDRLNHAIALADRVNKKVAVLCIDLDNFKQVNDSLGHACGDSVIRETGKRLQKVIQRGETLARLGGDEFVLIVENFKEMSEISILSDKLLDVFKKPFHIEGHEVFVTASMGISVYPDDGLKSEILLKHADTAMYKAKEQGRNLFQFYREEMNAGVLQRLMIESRLHKAIEEKELFMMYQPQIDLATGQMVGAEALIRWKNSQLGDISPSQFIPLAEETGLIGSIGHWAFLESCQKISEAKYLPPDFCISVNLSAKQLKNPGLIEDIQGILDSTGVSPLNVEVELTESVLVEDPEKVRDVLCKMRDIGLRVAVDDFGTGYSSFAYLKKFPISKLKIDRSFIKDLPHSAEDAAITKAIIALAHSLGMKVVAEGVENRDQVEFLILAQCDMAQGYFISRPDHLPNIKHMYDLGIF